MTKEHHYLTHQCINCNEPYETGLPSFKLEEERIAGGFCSNDCITRYVRLKGLSTKEVCGKNLFYLKTRGEHAMADWIAEGGLERLMEQNEDDA